MSAERPETVDLGVFARAFAVHTNRIAWLVGAGSSAAAGVPTAAQVVDDLLVRLYADAHGLVRQQLDVTNPSVMDRVHSYYDGQNGMPPRGDSADYSVAFELALPDAEARRQHLRQLVSGRAPSYAQRVMGGLLTSGASDLVVTTNFDDLIERAAAEAYSAAHDGHRRMLTVAALESADRGATTASDGAWPLLVKLHGDFYERSLKNIAPELQSQDSTLRQVITDASRSFGLVVAGYSGRDESVMDMLRTASQVPGAWPAGLWWVTRRGSELSPAVAELLRGASVNGIDARVVVADNFDEVMGSVANQVDLESGVRRYVDSLRVPARVIPAALPSHERRAFPAIRFNALPVLSAPTEALTVRRPDGGGAELVEQALREAKWRGASVVGSRDVLAFGSADQLGQALGAEPSISPIDPLSADPGFDVIALMGEALTRGLARRLPARPQIRRNGNRLVLLPPEHGRDDRHGEVRRRLADAYSSPLYGRLETRYGRSDRGEQRRFAEGLRLHLDRRFDTTWLVFVPFTWTEPTHEMAVAGRDRSPVRPVDPAAPWNLERWAQRRMNDRWVGIIEAWASALAPASPTTTVFALPRAVDELGDSVGGSFSLGHWTAYSREAS